MDVGMSLYMLVNSLVLFMSPTHYNKLEYVFTFYNIFIKYFFFVKICLDQTIVLNKGKY